MSFLQRLVCGLKEDHVSRNKAQAIVAQILSINLELRRLDSLEPGLQINRLLTSLVGLCASAQDQRVVDMVILRRGGESCVVSPMTTETAMADADIGQVLGSRALQRILPDLRDCCSTAEFMLEAHWSARIRDGDEGACDSGVWQPDDEDDDGGCGNDPWARLGAFPYFENYVELVRAELAAIYSILPGAPARIAYIGSGPLPLTSFCLLKALAKGGRADNPWGGSGSSSNVEILNIDRSADAVAASTALADSLGLSGKGGMRFVRADANDETLSFKGYQVVCLAALVGATQEIKEEFLCSIARRMDAGALLITRSAWGLRTCLYPELHVTDRLLEHLETCLVLHPHGRVINSVVVLRVKARPGCVGHEK